MQTVDIPERPKTIGMRAGCLRLRKACNLRASAWFMKAVKMERQEDAFDKSRGGYYTSADLADWLCAWAIRTSDDRVLEPSCGDGSFVEAAWKQLVHRKGDGRSASGKIIGVEMHAAEARKAKARVK